MRKIVVDRDRLVSLYEALGSCNAVGEAMGITPETVRRRLIEFGIPRVSPREERKQRTRARKYCPGVVGMLHGVLGCTSRDVADITGIPIKSVVTILTRKFGREKTCRKNPVSLSDYDIHEIEREYLEGASTYALAEKYGVSRSTITERMKRLGHTRGNRELERKTCSVCGAEFESVSDTRQTCSYRCRRKTWSKRDQDHSHRSRARRHGVEFDKSITLRGVFAAANGVCKICGRPCDWESTEYGHIGPCYPTIDHIVPFARGGAHTWDNVQLAHHYCNSLKSDSVGRICHVSAR